MQTESEINWYDFLRNKVNSFIKWDLVRFFYENPHTRDSAANIAQYVGRDVKTITRELNGLVASKVLLVQTVSGVEIYQFTSDPETRHTIEAFMDASHDREFRVKAIHHIIRGMQFTPRYDF